MKANEAPEKIYVPTTGDELHYHMACPNNEFQESIEYIRTDAFIEKAVSYLNSKLYDWVQTENPNQRSYANTIIKQVFVEDFRKYMKG